MLKYKVGDILRYIPRVGRKSYLKYESGKEVKRADIVTIRAAVTEPYNSYGFYEAGRIDAYSEDGWSSEFVEKDFELVGSKITFEF